MASLEHNICRIKAEIKEAAELSGRRYEDISIVAVTKNVSKGLIQSAVDSGIRIVGENRVQEARDKKDFIEGEVKWHLIGHLQKNKVKMAVRLFSMIQSVDSIDLIKEIDKRARKINEVKDVLIQINIGREDTKYGIDPDNVESFIRDASQYEYTRIKGLMAIAPFDKNPENVRPYFKKMNQIYTDLTNMSLNNVEMKYLSMGMTNDFIVAIEEGSNMVRIGTGIFGPRTGHQIL